MTPTSSILTLTAMADHMLLSLQERITRLKAAHPDDPAAVVSGIETWATEQRAAAQALQATPIMADFNRVFGPDGKMIRDWWLTPSPATHKAWLRRNAPPGSHVEHKTDIASEGALAWSRGKSAGDPPDRND